MVKGTCPQNLTADECFAAGLKAGKMHRTSSHTDTNTVLMARDAYDKCKALGYVGAQLQKCAAPVKNPFQ